MKEEQEKQALPLVESVPYQSAVPSNATETLCLVSVRGPAEQGRRRPLHLSCVLDRSGSMAGKKLDTLKATLRFMVKNLNSEDQLALVSYSDEATLDMELHELSDKGKTIASSAINQLRASGSTNLNDGLQLGLRSLVDADVDKRCVNAAVMLFTDGFANAGITEASEMVDAMHETVKSLKNYGTVSVYTFGFQKHDTTLLFTLANEQRGCYYNIKDASAIPTAFADCLGGLLSIVAQNAELHLRAREGVTLRYIHTRFPVVPECLRRAPKDEQDNKDDNGNNNNNNNNNNNGGTETEATVAFGDFILNEQRDILVTLSLPAVRPPVALSCELTFVDTADAKSHSHVCQLPLVTGEGGEVNLTVESHRLRLLAAEGLDLTAQEPADAAISRLKSLLDMIKASPAKDLPVCQTLLSDLSQCMESLSLSSTEGVESLMWKAGEMARGYRGVNEAQQMMIREAQQACSSSCSSSGGGNSFSVTGRGVGSSSSSGASQKSRAAREGKEVSMHTPVNAVRTAAFASDSAIGWIESGSVRVGQMIVANEETMLVTSLCRSKAGKHGHAKCLFHLKNPITNATTSAIFPTSTKVILVREIRDASYHPHTGDPSVVFRYEVEVLEVDSNGNLSVADGTGNINVQDFKLSNNAFGKDVRQRVSAGQSVTLQIFQTTKGETMAIANTPTDTIDTTTGATPPTNAAAAASVNNASASVAAAVAAKSVATVTAVTTTNDTLAAGTSAQVTAATDDVAAPTIANNAPAASVVASAAAAPANSIPAVYVASVAATNNNSNVSAAVVTAPAATSATATPPPTAALPASIDNDADEGPVGPDFG